MEPTRRDNCAERGARSVCSACCRFATRSSRNDEAPAPVKVKRTKTLVMNHTSDCRPSSQRDENQLAQGCEERATLGELAMKSSTLKGLKHFFQSTHIKRGAAATLSGLCVHEPIPQGSSFLATLGWRMESLWDSRRWSVLLLALTLPFLLICAISCSTVPSPSITEREAIRVALISIGQKFGPDCVAKEKPFTGELSNNVWTVRGTLPPGFRGGTAVAEVSAETGKVLRMWHEK